MNTIDYSIIVPVYNAENSLVELNNQIIQFFEGKYTFEIIYVDDYSQDQSWEVLKDLKNKNNGITIVKLAKNFGQHGATLCGCKYAQGNFAITIDDDLEIQPNEISKLIEKQQSTKADIVYGLYKKENSGLLRSGLTTIYKWLSKVEGKNKGKGSSFRLIKKDVYTKLVENHRHFVFIDELILWYTHNIAFTDINFNKAFFHKKRYKTFGLIRLTSNLILFSSDFPLKLVTYLGLLLASTNFIFGMYFILKKVFFRIDYPGFAAIIVSVLFSTGIIIFSIGIIAQYIRHMLKNSNNAPSYNESEIYRGTDH
jgi:undecaprenyl-phosphate 4-deoxy-4-formamido-L-arabinose transferase